MIRVWRYRHKGDLEKYLHNCEFFLQGGFRLPEPTTREQLIAVLDRWPRQAARFRPSPWDCRNMNLPHLARESVQLDQESSFSSGSTTDLARVGREVAK